MNIKNFTVFSIFMIILSILILILSTLKSRALQLEITQLEDNRFNSMLLAQELLHTSEDLTRMARAYVITGDAIYKNYFHRILSIRNGELPRPVDYSPTYWHFQKANKKHTITTGETIALKELMLKRNLTFDEIALLNESQKESDQLVNIEKQAFAAIKGLLDNGYGELTVQGYPDSKLARDLLWGDEYIEGKARIMVPLKKFMLQLNERTQAEFKATQVKINQITLIQIGILMLMLIGSIVTACYIRLRMLLPLESLTQQTKAIASGNYTVHCKVAGTNEVAMLGTHFNNMAEAVQDAIKKHEQSEVLLLQSELRLKEAQHMTQVGSWELHLINNGLFWSDEIFRIFEIDQKKFDASYESFLNLIHPEDRDLVNQAYTSSVETGEPYEIIHRLLMLDGRIKYVEERCKTYYDEQGNPIISKGTIQDITERQQSEETIKLYASVFELSGEAMVITDAQHKVIAINEAYHKLTGYKQQEILGQNLGIFRPTENTSDEDQMFWRTLNDKDFWQGEITNCHKNGHGYVAWLSITVIRNNQNQATNYIAGYKDISEHKAATDKIHYLAHHDSLTNLPNRFALNERLTQAINSAQRNKKKIAVLFIDLDRFKFINDTLGHHIGDLLLVNVAERLKSCARNNDIVARLGGDEFVVALLEIENKELTFHVADKILHALGQSHSLDGHDLHSTPSVGIAFFPDDGNNVDEVMKNADVAMYHAKSNGRNNYQFFEPSMNQITLERIELEHDLQAALEREEFVLHYQPKFNANTLQVVGVEALIRWQHPKKGLISPEMFIPLAEESGLMLSLGKWVLCTACRQLRLWQKQGIANLQVSVNLSASQFRQKDLSTMVSSILAKENVDPTLLEIEITESVAMNNPQESVQSMQKLRKIGVKLAVDDFGTGYSSLSYLKQFPINYLKMDRSYVKDIETDPSDAVICSSTISLAHNLGLSVVAEGVETNKQYEYLKRLNCDIIQGYYFCKPLPASKVEAYITSRNINELTQTAPATSINILVIDDDKLTCEFHNEMLKNLGHKPTSALDPVEGLQIFRKNPDHFRLIMLDMLMPNMSGVDLIQAIRKINIDVPIMVVTGYKPDAIRKALRVLEIDHNLRYGINCFILEKPLTAKISKEYINKIL